MNLRAGERERLVGFYDQPRQSAIKVTVDSDKPPIPDAGQAAADLSGQAELNVVVTGTLERRARWLKKPSSSTATSA